MANDDCLFCKIVAGSIPSNRVYEDADTLAFLDIHPNNPGHALIIPREHFPDIYDTPDETLGAMMKAARKIAHAQKASLKADGVNITMNNEPAAGQIIFHAHIHVIPRFTDDGYQHWPKRAYKEGEAEATAEKIRSALSQG